MYDSSTALIENELDSSTIKPIYNIFKSASIIYRDIIRNDVYNSALKSNLNGLILNFIIQKHFEPKYVSKDLPFQTFVNRKGRHKIIEIHKNKILLTINKANKNCLPSLSKYKLDYSSWNFGLDSKFQLRYDNNHQDPQIITEQYYGIITYTLSDAKFEFIDIIIPDSKFKTILNHVSITPSVQEIKIDSVYADEKDDGTILSEENIRKGIKEEIAREVSSL